MRIDIWEWKTFLKFIFILNGSFFLQLMNKVRVQFEFWKLRKGNREHSGSTRNFPKRPSFISTHISFNEFIACTTVSLSSKDPIYMGKKREFRCNIFVRRHSVIILFQKQWNYDRTSVHTSRTGSYLSIDLWCPNAYNIPFRSASPKLARGWSIFAILVHLPSAGL